MRTTLNTIYSHIQTNLTKITSDIEKANAQISSGMQMSTIAEAPVNLVSALRFRTSIAELDQYTQNIQNGNTIISAGEAAMTQMKELVLRAKTLAIQATDPAYSAANREAVAQEVENLFQEAVYLGNTQVNGKYILGGFRSTGYTADEPAPFIADKGDGYWVNGKDLTPIPGALTTGLLGNTSLAAGDLQVNGSDVGPVVMNGALTQGLNMSGAVNLKAAVNGIGSPAVTATLTTLTAGVASLGSAGLAVDFSINGEQISYTSQAGTPAQAAQEAADQINLATSRTGVTAELGSGSNGGVANSVVLRNAVAGDESSIVLSGFGAAATNVTGLSSGTYSVAARNTGQVSLSSSGVISITSGVSDDTILSRVGLGGGGVGNYDTAGDGRLSYGYPLAAGELKINGIAVPATASDGLSTRYADASAQAKATAINAIQDQTGVTALVVPAYLEAAGVVQGGTEAARLTGQVSNNPIAANSLAINGTVISGLIPAGPVTGGLNTGKALNVKSAINQHSVTTGVTAKLTTMSAGAAVNPTGSRLVRFDLNGVTVSVTTGGGTATDTAAELVSAINAVSDQTGVTAAVGNGQNGGVVDSLVLQNSIPGNENDIVLANLSAAEATLTGLANATYSPDATHNTGQISLESKAEFTISSPGASPPSDIFLTELGLLSADNSGKLTHGSTPTYLDRGDLVINGVDIFATVTAITAKDFTNTLLDRINAQSDTTGVKATRGVDGSLRLASQDGRNLHVQTSANGEVITSLTNGRRDMLISGSIQLRSERKFILETVDPAVQPEEPGLAALGLAGGESVSGESGDLAGDGKIDVFGVHDRIGTVRYAGDRVNDLEVKIGKTSTMTVGKNGQAGVMDTDIYTTLKGLANYLRSENFTTVTGIHAATDIRVPLNSKGTGLEPDTLLPDEDLFSAGTFKVTITDHDYSPARNKTILIGVDPTLDTLESVTKRLDGIPNLSASWTSEGRLQIQVRDQQRYTVALSDDNTNFLKAAGVSDEFMQAEGLQKSIADLDSVMAKLTEQVSDFGARANRIDIQSQIYSNVTIATKGNLSEVQDTDMIKAVMDMQAKQTAYQAALSAAAKTMQLSLVDYLK